MSTFSRREEAARPRSAAHSAGALRSPSPAGPDRGEGRRRALSTPSLNFTVEGDEAAAARLKKALAVPPVPSRRDLTEEELALVERALVTHWFHSYAARTHPLLVRELLAELPRDAVVLDPFVGSGTVLVEALLAGGRGIGCDVNPLSVRLSRFKSTPLPAAMREALRKRAAQIAEASLQRVKQRKGPPRTWDRAKFYEPHVFLELCGLRAEIEAVSGTDAPLFEALLLILSSLIIKSSRQRAETSSEQVRRAIGRGQVTRWFLSRTEEVARLHAALAERLEGKTWHKPLCEVGDARALSEKDSPLPLWPASVDRVITSPPYLGTYDYAAHHERRFAWLDIDPETVFKSEMAARRHGEATPIKQLIEQHGRETAAWVRGVARLLRPGGRLQVIVGDSAVRGQPLPGDLPIRIAAEKAGLRFIARASVERPPLPDSVVPRPEPVDAARLTLPPRFEHLLEFARGE